MVNFILKKALPIPKIESFDKYLFIGPHPDDIEVSSGGTVAKLAKLGKIIRFVIVTDGQVGSLDQTLSNEELIKIRKEESINSAKILGVNDIHFLNFHDGADYDLKEMEKAILGELLNFKPDIVFVPDGRVLSEYHLDHINVSNASINACFNAGWIKINERFGYHETHNVKAVSMYYTDKANSYVKAKKYRNIKIEAIKCHKSQFTSEDINNFKKYFKLREFKFGIKKFSFSAEGFRTYSLGHMHCVPEASKF